MLPTTDATAQESPSLFGESGDTRPGTQETVVRKRTATLDFALLASRVEEGGGSLTLNLFDDVSVVAETERIQRWSASQYTWFGQLVEFPLETVAIEVDQHAKIAFARLTVDGRPYRIEHRQENQYEIQELNPVAFGTEPPEDTPEEGERNPIGIGDPGTKSGTESAQPNNIRSVPKLDVSANALDAETKAWKNGSEVIDVLVLYTEQARDSSGGASQMEASIRSGINEANQSFQNSGVNARLRLAASRLVTYNEGAQNGISDIRGDLRSNGNTSGDTANRLRNNYGADIVGLVVSDSQDDFCGMAYIMNNVSTSHRDRAYFVVEEGDQNCMTGNRSMTHEIGHIMGARHDRNVDDRDGRPFSYNHGFVNITSGSSGRIGWRTVMAYNDRCQNARSSNSWCSRINWWSDPDDTRGGTAMGVASGSNAADNVRALNNTASTVSSFKSPSPIVSGTVTDLITGSGLAGVEIRGPLGPITDANGEYTMFVHWGSVQLRPSRGDYEFTPGPAVTLNNVTSNRTQDFDAGIYHDLTGSVYVGSTRQLLSNVELDGAPGSPPPPIPNVGSYSFEVLEGWSGTITPQSEKYTFSPSSKTYNGVTNDVKQDFVATIKTYTLSGTVRDSDGNPVSGVTMQGLPRSPTTNTFGEYSSTVDYGWSGTVTPQKDGYNFGPASKSYSNLDQDVQQDYSAEKSVFADSDWPMFGGDPAHTRWHSVGDVENNVRWSSNIGADAGSPVLGTQGNVYVGAEDGSLYAFDDEGTKLWSTKSVPGDSIHGAPVAASGYRFYVPVDGGNLIAYDGSGALTWSRYLDGELHGSPVVDADGTIYVGSDSDSLYAVNPDGSVQWAAGTGDKVRSSPAIGPSGVIYVGSDDGYLYAFRPDGTQKWRFQTGGKIRSSPAVDTSGTLYVGSDDDKLYAIDTTGTKQWSYQTGGNVRSSPAIGKDGTVYVGSNDGSVYAITTSGQKLWSFSTGGPVVSSPSIGYDENDNSPELPEETVYVGSDDGSLYALNAKASSASSRQHWRYRTQSPVQGSPALADGALYVGGDDDRLYSFGASRSDGLSRAQVVAAAMAPTPEEILIVNQLAEEAGIFGEPSWTDPGGCEGGPLIIPACGGPGARFGGATGFKEIIAGESVRFGALAPWVLEEGLLEPILAGETTTGLEGDFVTQFDAETNYLAVISGFASPSEHEPNPNGRSTGLNLFVKEDARPESTDPEMVQVLAGHFVPDAPEMTLSLQNTDQNLGALKYGDFGTYHALPPGRYTVVMEPSGESLAKQQTSLRQTLPLDLTGKAGETIALLANGSAFSSDQPPMTIRAVGPRGEMTNLSRREGELAPGISSIPGLLEDDLLLAPGERQPVSLEPHVRLDGLRSVPLDALAIQPMLSTESGAIEEPVPTTFPESFDLPGSKISFLSPPEKTEMVGRPLEEMPSSLAEVVASQEAEPTHLGRAVLSRPDGRYELWMAMRTERGYALPMASLLLADVATETGETASAIRTSYLPDTVEISAFPEPGEPFQITMALDAEVSRFGDGFEPISDARLAVGTSGEIVSVDQASVGQNGQPPAKIESPIVLRPDEFILGPEGQRSPVRDCTYAVMDRGETQHELAALLAGAADEENQLTVERGQVYRVGRSDALESVVSTTVETDQVFDFGPTGVDVRFEGTDGSGTVTVRRFGNGPSGFQGIAGNTISNFRFVIKKDEGLTFASGTELRLDVSTLPGIQEPRTVTVYQRPTPGEGPFHSLSTSYDPETNELMAPISSFSEFVLASDSSPLPVELSRMDVRQNPNEVILKWSTASETDNAGFEVQRRTSDGGRWSALGFVDGTGTTSEPQSYRFTDSELPYAADSLTYRLRQVDTDGTASFSDRITVDRAAPEQIQLEKTFPNPAHRRATVRFAVPRRQDVLLKVYDVLGRQVATLHQGTVEAGRKQLQLDVASLSSGVYFLKLTGDGRPRTRRFTVVK